MSNQGKNTLTSIKNNLFVRENLTKLLYKKKDLDYNDAFYLYSVAFSLIEAYESDNDKELFIEYAYYIIAVTSFKTKNYQALYDFSVNMGFYPLGRKILELGLIDEESMEHLVSNAAIEEFNDGSKILTYEQQNVFHDFLTSKKMNISFIAPTSYGKSELIFEHIEKNNHLNCIGIIVPTKALIDQVFQDAKKIEGLNRKVIIHDQNFNSKTDNRILAIVTQERALRLIEKDLIFDLLYIDEAHEIMEFSYVRDDSNRSLLLTRLLRISKVQNDKLILMYLSPLINDTNNIRIIDQEEIEMNKVYKNLKLMNIFYLSSEMSVKQYDRFLGCFTTLKVVKSHRDYIAAKSLDKNLHFLFKPIYIEKYAEELYNGMNISNVLPKEISELINELKSLVHPNFKLIKYLSKGIIYLHGKMPLIIRNYLLKFVKENKFIRHFIANSVVLAGMNMPVDNLFYISGDNKQGNLHNLIGRVNRLNEIFHKDNNSLSKIFIPIHFIELENYPQFRRGSMVNKIEGLRKEPNEEVRNPLLAEAKINNDNSEKAKEIQTAEKHIIEQRQNPDFYAKLLIGGAQQLLNYNDLGLEKLKIKITNFGEISDENILKSIKELFFDDFDEKYFTPQFNVNRLRNIETINSYEKFIKDINTLPLRQRIEKLVQFWKSRFNANYKIYVGTAFGEEPWDTTNYNNGRNVYVHLDKHKNDLDYLYNLALIKLQIDEDFLAHEISLLVNTLLVLKLISEEQFNKFMYGTEDDNELQALQLGISKNVFLQLKKDSQINNIQYDDYGNPKANKELIDYINKQKGIVNFELVKYFL